MIQSTLRLSLLAVLASSFHSATAIPAPEPAVTTLAVPPFFNDDLTSPLPAVVLGVDSAGHTTYAIQQDLIESDVSATKTTPFTATLVEGASYASYTFSISAAGLRLDLGFDCTLDSAKNEAVCQDFDQESSQSVTATIPSLTGLVLDVISTAGAGGNGGNGGNGQSGGQGGASGSGPSASASSQSDKPNGAFATSPKTLTLGAVGMLGVVVGAGWVF